MHANTTTDLSMGIHSLALTEKRTNCGQQQSGKILQTGREKRGRREEKEKHSIMQQINDDKHGLSEI